MPKRKTEECVDATILEAAGQMLAQVLSRGAILNVLRDCELSHVGSTSPFYKLYQRESRSGGGGGAAAAAVAAAAAAESTAAAEVI